MERRQPDEGTKVLHHWNIISKGEKKEACKHFSVESVLKQEEENGPGPVTWTVTDIAKAACLLSTPPKETHFEDEQEMRRVYTLIYDVFRCNFLL